MKKIGILTTAYPSDNEFGIDFDHYVKSGYGYYDYQGFTHHGGKVYQMDEKTFDGYFLRMKNESDERGLKCSQLHMLWDPDFENNRPDDFITYYIRSIRGAWLLGCPYCVLHPVTPVSWGVPYTEKEISDFTKAFVKQLLPYCEKYGVRIAIENLPFSWMQFFSPLGTLKLIEEIDSEYVCMCVDTGHFNIMDKDVYNTIVRIGDKLKVLHTHDNNGIRDQHLFPYAGTFDWDAFTKGLRDIHFDGVLSLETRAKAEALSPEEFEKEDRRLHDIVSGLADKVY